MDQHAEDIISRLVESEMESPIEMLYNYYREWNTLETEEIRKHFSDLNDILEKLPLRELDEVWYRVCDLCIAYQKTAFVDGVRIGVKMMEEL